MNDVFTAAYRQKCLNAQKLESFTVTAPVSEYHYTLYYYGQAGNLIKTVPPTGVDISKFTDANWSASVASARAGNQLLTPSHTMATVYRYNTLNQVTAQYTPDAHKSEFWYDRLGRLSISQNAKQKNNSTENGRKYSYTLYDYLGRITEVGEYINPSTSGMSQTISRSQPQLTSWLGTQANRSQITSTVYDLEYPGWVLPDKVIYAKNLRNRVAYTSYTQDSNPLNFNAATFYTYDILGNVDTLIQDYGSNSASNGTQNMMNKNNNRWKKIVYQYDLISGKVNHVAYEPQYVNPSDGKLYRPNDAMYHKYEYDAENRLTAAYTSTDSVIWEKDARYEYYLHGPLARTVLGDQLVQGTDYAYTLQGWLKGVNSINQSTDRDMGGDGYGAAGYDQNKFVAKDAFGFSLDYFRNDYTSIKNTVLPFIATPIGTAFKPLYNGNISSMGVNIKNLNKPGGGQGAVLYNYGYDQLNRLTAMDAYVGLTNNTWTPELRDQYAERIAYDGNGNILKYLRNGDKTTKVIMDSLSYKYNAATNQLNYVRDSVPDNDYPSSGYIDLDNQAVNNYGYDEIGNLIKDDAEGVTSIEWNVYGKITKQSFSTTTVGQTKNVYYYYDAAGNRMGKRNEKNAATGTTNDYLWYVRDASGNVMADYNSNPATNDNIPGTLTVKERHLYGSSRLGIFTLKKDVKATPPSGAQDAPYNISFFRGYKSYELTNHLGNVLSTISDEKFGHDGGGGIVDYFDADVLGASDYYPFGATQPNRSTGTSYRYGFNGKEKDKEGMTQYDYGFRIYDPRLGRFKSVDPKAAKMPAWSPYSINFNNPIRFIDPDGQEPTPAEAARISAHVYGDKKNSILTGGWQVSSRDFGIQLQNDAGLKSLVYERVVDGKVTEYTYATAGTENWTDWKENGKQPLGLSDQYHSAANNAKKISSDLGETELNYVGHSLGGGEAALNSLVTDGDGVGRKAFTFNAAGVGDITKFVEGTWKTPFKSESKIDAYILRTDPLNKLQNNSPLMPDVNGNKHYLWPKDLPSTYNGHSIDNIIKNFGVDKPEEYKK